MGASIFRAPGIDQNSHMATTKRDLEMITHIVSLVCRNMYIIFLFFEMVSRLLLFLSLAVRSFKDVLY